MNKNQIIARIGDQRYWDACSKERKFASDTGKSLSKNFESDVAHEISDLIWDSSSDQDGKLNLVFQVYEDMPCYALLMYISMHFGSFPEETVANLWNHYRRLLSDEDTLAEPIAYSLWCDFFEDDATACRSWDALISGVPCERLLQRILIASGPVPFVLKEWLYTQLIPDQRWHHFIFRSLFHSQFDVYGNIDQLKALSILKLLDLPNDTEGLDSLKTALATGLLKDHA